MARTKEPKKEEMSLEDKATELMKRFAKPEHDKFFISSGSIGFDKDLGGGYQSGRVYEFISWEGGGKTTLALHAAANCKKACGREYLYIDAEHALDRKYAENIGLEWNEKLIFQPSNGEEGFEYAKEMITTNGIGVVIFDSTSGLLPKKQMEDPAGTSNLGLHARLMGQEIPKIVDLANKHNVVIIFISQFREKIGVMFGSPETTQGGNALKFWASGRIEFRKQVEKEGDEAFGILSKYHIIKNKTAAPYKRGAIPIKFGEGIDIISEVINLGTECELFKKWGDSITFLDGSDSKYTLSEFRTLLKDNEEFYNDIRNKILLNYETAGVQVD